MGVILDIIGTLRNTFRINKATFDAAGLTAARTFTLPDTSGTVKVSGVASPFVFTPFSAEFPATDFPQLQLVNRRPVLSFDASVQETCQWTGIAPQGFTGTKTAMITYMMASATTNLVDFEVSLEAVTDGDNTDLDAGDSFDTVNSASATVPGTAGYIDQLSVTLTNADSIAEGDYFRIKLSRDADDGTNDTASGDCHVLAVEMRYGG